VSGEDIVCVLIKAVCTDLRVPAENPDLLSCDANIVGAFREQMRAFHDLLREKPASIFILLGQSSISTASLLM
jgi:hypothetical protein